MPLTVVIPGALRCFAGGTTELPVEPSSPTVAGALESLWRACPGIRDRLLNEQGQIREHINVFVGNENIRYTGGLETPVRDGEQITIVPSISGGSEQACRHNCGRERSESDFSE